MNISVGKLTNLGCAVGTGEVDLFIGSASFEGRCRSVMQNVDSGRIKRALVAVNRTFGSRLDENEGWFGEVLGDRIERLDVFSHDPVSTLLNVQRSVRRLLELNTRSVIVDITTFTRESLIMLVHALNQHRMRDTRITFIYATASEYSIGSLPDSSRWLSAGVRHVWPVLGFTGQMIPSRDTHMIIMVGFEDERALELIRWCEPTHVSLGICDPTEPDMQSHHATNEQRLFRLRSILPNVSEFRFPGYDASATEAALKARIGQFRDCNVVIAPMNTKISTMGAAFLAFRDQSIQLCYANPYFYNFDNYSRPGEDYYLFSVPAVRSE